jgi:hypothetical protein
VPADEPPNAEFPVPTKFDFRHTMESPADRSFGSLIKRARIPIATRGHTGVAPAEVKKMNRSIIESAVSALHVED